MDDKAGYDLLLNPWTWVAYGLAAFYMLVVIRELFAWRKELRNTEERNEKK
jgi:hypothetical protein